MMMMMMMEHSHVCAASALGISLHLLVFIHGEWHLKVVPIFFGHLLAFALVHLLRLHDGGGSTWTASVRVIGAYLAGLFGSMVVYRVFFHRIRHFPGPRLAAVTKLWHVWQARHSENYLVMRRMYEQYGEFVRTGPNEISIFRPDAVHVLDGYKNTNTRDVWYDILHPRKALVFCRDPDEIRELRGAWSQAVSSKCLVEYSSRIIHLSDVLVECIRSYGNEPVSVNDVMSWFSFDVMGEILFGEDFGMMVNKKAKGELIHQRTALALIAPINDASWIAHLGFNLFPFLGAVRGWWAAVRFCCERMERRMKTTPTKLDMASFFIHEYESPSTPRSPADRHNLLMGSSISAIVAGSDTTRASLTGIWYYLCKYPAHAAKLYDELRDLDINDVASVPKLAALPHLNAVIKETMRLAPPAMTGSNRITGKEGIRFGGVVVPPGVKVTAPKFVLHRLPNAFQYPNEFLPERWTTRPELILDARAYAPFSVGPHQCIGKAISHLEMRLVTSKLIKTFGVSFSPDHDKEAFWGGMKDQVTMMPGRMFCLFGER
ncbi:cytochrome P450 monooxygenase-like protein, partial [Decorospora gaudefroyi]